MLEKVKRCGDRLPSETFEQVGKSLIINRKLPFSGHYFEETIKSISTRSTNYGLWGIWRNVQDVGRYMERLLKKLATDFVSQYSARII